MSEIELNNGKNGTIEYTEFPDLAGDVIINIDDREKQGTIFKGGISGSVIFPGAINNPDEPIGLDDDTTKLAGSVVPSEEFSSSLNTLLEMKRILRNSIEDGVMTQDRYNEIVRELDDNYNWNEEYMSDTNISSFDKIKDVESVVNDNLNSIKEYAKEYQADLGLEDNIGNTR